MTYVLLLLIVAMPPNDHPIGLDGGSLQPGIVYPYTQGNATRPFIFRTLDDCKERMVLMAHDVHEQSPEMKFVLRCQPVPFYDGESA